MPLDIEKFTPDHPQIARQVADDLSQHHHAKTPNANPADPLGGDVAVRPEALLPNYVFQPGEIVILLLKPSPWFILLWPLAFYLYVTTIVAILVVLTNKFFIDFVAPRDIITLGILIILMRIVWQFLDWLGRTYVLTDRRMIRIQGVLRINIFECQLKQIQHTTAHFTIRERLFTLGTIGWATAGTAGVNVYWRMIAKPLETHQIIVKTIERYR